MDATAIDLFCGAGGLAYGLKSAGLTVAAGVDLDPACKFPLETNTGAVFQELDVTDVAAEHLNTWFGDAPRRVLAGCAPCQPFSTYSQSRKSKDDRWMLLRQFKRLALEVLPDVVTMENVAGLAKQDVWTEFTDALEAAGYHVKAWEVDCTDYGVPQRRKRLVMLASLLGPIELDKPQRVDVSVKQAIGHLESIPAGASAIDDPLHSASVLSPKNLERIAASTAGGTWRDWPVELRAPCHRRPTGKTYPSVYGRMEWSKPAPTITTQCYGFGNGRFGHPEQDRAISLREAALLQSFPKEYAFLKPGELVNFTRLGTLIGNAVPPKLGEAIGASIRRHLEAHAGALPVY
ncbi:MAG: DNA cytosine methyltransferase [Phenylobacterium sp.]|nr:MAG: DNA cytosine methyltransferase [Phenylobacterium sp.]